MHVRDRKSGFLCRGLCVGSLALALIALGAGCGGGGDETDYEIDDDSITINEERNWSDADSAYDWESPGTTARLKLLVDDFNHGSMEVRILDALGAVIFQEVYWTYDGWYYIDWEYSDVAYTDPGEAGLWTIELSYYEFTGEVTLVVESTDRPAAESAVQQPALDSLLLDLTFGDYGRAAYAPDRSGSRRIARDSFGRLVTAGTTVTPEGMRRLTVWRRTVAGALDAGFGTGGVFVYDNAALAASGGADVAVDASNRVLVAGWFGDDLHRTDAAVMRLTSGGALDTTFSGDGIVTFDDGEDEVAAAVAVDGAGRVLLAGSARTADNSAGYMFLARLTSAGALDNTFATAGIYESTDTGDRGWDVAMASGNRPVVLGIRGGAMILWRFTDGGALDATFGGDGIVTSGGAGEYRIGRGLCVHSDDTVKVAGFRIYEDGVDPTEMLVWAYQADGDPELTFSGDGLLEGRYLPGVAAATGVVVDGSGRLLVCGVTRSSGVAKTDSSATIWRFLATGLSDPTLPGSGGTGMARIDPRPDDAGTLAGSLVLGAGGSAYVAGTAFDRTNGASDAIIWKLSP